jgi:epoxyqueuosine reductase
MNLVDWSYTEEAHARTYSKFQSWREHYLHGNKQSLRRYLQYLLDHRGDKRKDLRLVYPAFQSATVFLFSYAQEKSRHQFSHNSEQQSSPFLKEQQFASYALAFDGLDYHEVLTSFLKRLGDNIKVEFSIDHPDIDYQITLDTSPVLERDLAYRTGLGWFGKNTMLISSIHGSYTLIGSLLWNKRLDKKKLDQIISIKSSVLSLSSTQQNHCGHCRACIDACPTEAIDEQLFQLDVTRCLSFLTIEVYGNEETILSSNQKQNTPFFGCDICQDVCPWNKKTLIKFSDHTNEKQPNKLTTFFTSRPIVELLKDLEQMGNRQFRKFFSGTVIARPGRLALMKNLRRFLQS